VNIFICSCTSVCDILNLVFRVILQTFIVMSVTYKTRSVLLLSSMHSVYEDPLKTVLENQGLRFLCAVHICPFKDWNLILALGILGCVSDRTVHIALNIKFCSSLPPVFCLQGHHSRILVSALKECRDNTSQVNIASNGLFICFNQNVFSIVARGV
jgi:hypothetical protein